MDAFPVVQRNLLEISRSCWGNEQYGLTAASYLLDLQHSASFSVYVDSTIKDVRVNSELPAGFIDVFDELRGQGLGETEDPDALKGAFLGMLNDLPLPFQFSVNSAGYGHALYRSVINGLAVGKLEMYMGKSGLAAHSLHGTLGKSLDALNIASGAGRQTVPNTALTEDFVQIADLFSIPSDLTSAQRRTILRKTAIIALRQLRQGVPDGRGELVIEGPFDIVQGFESLANCAVTRDSLPIIRSEFEQGIIGRFLDSIIES